MVMFLKLIWNIQFRQFKNNVLHYYKQLSLQERFNRDARYIADNKIIQCTVKCLDR